MKLAQSFFVTFVFLLLGLNGAYAADQRPVVTDPALNMDSQPHWHLGDPGREIGPEKALLFVKQVDGVDQIFMVDMTDPAQPQELQLTNSPGNKADPVWGPKLAKIRVPKSPDFFNAFLNLPVPAGSTIVDEIGKRRGQIRGAYRNGKHVDTYLETWVIFYTAVANNQSIIVMKPLGGALQLGSVKDFLNAHNTEILLTQPNLASLRDNKIFRDARPVVNFMRQNLDPFNQEVNSDQIKLEPHEMFQIAYIRQNDPHSEMAAAGGTRPNMLYKLDIYPEFIDLDKFLRKAFYRGDAAGLKASYLKNNLTYAYSGNCIGGKTPLADADHPEWFPDGKNLAFEFTQRVANSNKQIATVNVEETPLNACRLINIDGVDTSTSSLVAHTESNADHEFPRVSPTPLFVGGKGPYEYGILFNVKDKEGNYTLGSLVVDLKRDVETNRVYRHQYRANSEVPLAFVGPDKVNRRHPVWARPVNNGQVPNDDVRRQEATIAFEREEDGHYQIYGAKITLDFVDRECCKLKIPHHPFWAHLGISQAFAAAPAPVFDEVPFTRCGGDHTWPEFTGNSTLNADGDFPFDASYLLADDSKHVMHLFDLPAPADNTCSVVVPTCAEQNPDSPDTDGDGVVDACDACPSDALASAAGDTCALVCDVPPGSPGDADADGKADVCDNCPSIANADQVDGDQNGRGDACDPLASLDECLALGGQGEKLDMDINCVLKADCPATDANGDRLIVTWDVEKGTFLAQFKCLQVRGAAEVQGSGCGCRMQSAAFSAKQWAVFGLMSLMFGLSWIFLRKRGAAGQ